MAKNCEDESSYTCDTCFNSFSSKVDLQVHQIDHLPKRLYKPCPHCNKLFTLKSAIRSHIINVHTKKNKVNEKLASKDTKEKSFVCEICGKACKEYNNLINHQLTHSDERPYKCTKCPATYKNHSTLKRHKIIHQGIKFPCPQCDAELTTKQGLRMHQLVHSNVKKYKCKRCGDEFKRSCSLKKHLIKHMGLRLYKCQFCGKMYTDGSSCRNHKKKYHPVELAEFEATGKTVEVTRAPKLEWLQPKSTDEEDEDDTDTED